MNEVLKRDKFHADEVKEEETEKNSVKRETMMEKGVNQKRGEKRRVTEVDSSENIINDRRKSTHEETFSSPDLLCIVLCIGFIFISFAYFIFA